MSDSQGRSDRIRALGEGILRSPMRLRVVIGGLMFGSWFLAVYQPAVDQIERAKRRLDTETKRSMLADEIAGLREQTERFMKRVPPKADQNEVVQHLLEGIRSRPVKLVNLEPKGTVELGPFKLLQVGVSLEGDYAGLEQLLRWIETEPRMFRVEQIRMEPEREKATADGGAQYTLELLVLSVLG